MFGFIGKGREDKGRGRDRGGEGKGRGEGEGEREGEGEGEGGRGRENVDITGNNTKVGTCLLEQQGGRPGCSWGGKMWGAVGLGEKQTVIDLGGWAVSTGVLRVSVSVTDMRRGGATSGPWFSGIS